MFVNPKEVVEALDIAPGMHIADLGCGSGHYTFAAAKRLEGKGRVYAVDVHKDMLTKIAAEADERGVFTVEVLWGDVEKGGGTHLADGAIDAAICSNILFHVDDKDGLAQECARILKGDGDVLVIDWSGSFGGLGPPEDRVVPLEETVKLFTRHGFELTRQFEPGAPHYALVFQKRT